LIHIIQEVFQTVQLLKICSSAPIFSIFVPLMTQNRKIIALLSGLFLSTIGYSQVNNTFFTRVDTTAFSGGSRFQLQVDQLSFARNTEYKSKITRGKTLLGYQLESSLKYRINESAYLKGGLWLKRDFGGMGFHQIQPIFSLHIKKKNTEVIFGNLLGTTDHELIEPMLDPEKTITDRVESGLQLRHNTSRFKADIWIDWQTMIYENSPFQEQFVAGYNTSLNLVDKKNIKGTIFSQLIAFHRGGEIDATISQNVSQYNFNQGAKLKIFPEHGLLKSVELRADFVYYEDKSTLVENTYIDGLGQLVSLTADFNQLRFMLQYWDSHQFQSAQGDRVYHSVSRINPILYNTNYRKMLILRGAYEKQIADELSFLFRTQLVQDLHEQTQDVIMELFFRWKFAHNFDGKK
jgi:hypothetical protein